jgi:hypothetical protein
MTRLEFKSPHDGSLLSFAITERFEDAIEFSVQVKTPNFSGMAPPSTFMSAPLDAWFQGMADEWTGWQGEKNWGDLESRVTLSATAEATGHIRIKVTLTGPDYDSELRVNIMFDAGQLESMAGDVALLFASKPNCQ